MKKLIGLSCGRKNGNSETLLKAAAMGAEELGAETEIIRAMDLRVLPCNACRGCLKTGQCVKKDDTDWILEKTVMGDTGLIVAAPVYHVRTNGYLLCISEKMNHVWRKDCDVLKKTRVGAVISVGGSGYDGWASLGLTTVNLFVQHIRLLVDQIQVIHAAEKGAVLTPTHRDTLGRAKELGRNVVRAMDMPLEKREYIGVGNAAGLPHISPEGEVSCPVCHCNVVFVPDDLPNIACPICRVRGVVSVDDGKMKVNWNMEDAKHPRFSYEGEVHHMEWLANHRKEEEPALVLGSTKKLMKEYAAYGKFIKPEET